MRSSIAALTLLAFLGIQTLAFGQGSRLGDLIERAKKKPPKARAAEEAPAPAAAAGKIREEYVVNAQYRGTVKKAFMDIGRCTVSYDTLGGGKFNVRCTGSVTDPDNKARTYEFDVDADYKLDGERISRLADRSKFNNAAEPHRERVLKDTPFMYIVKFVPYPPVNKEITWLLDGREFVTKYVRTDEGEMQVTILERGGMIGKFFLEPDESIPHTVKKIRVMGTNDVVLSFVAPQYSARK